MGALDQVTQMKSQGLSENEIVAKLQEQGIAPKEISEALGQSQIKSAVADEGAMQPQPQEYAQQDAGSYDQQGGSMDYGQQAESPIQEEYYPQNPYENYGEGDYEGYGAYDSGMNTDAFIEVAEQVFSEKMKTIQKQLDNLNEFKALAQINLDNNTDRIKRVEQTMDKLQMAILDRVGAYGKSLEGIKREMTMMQDSFGKMVKPIVAHAAAKQRIPVAKPIVATTTSIAKKAITRKKKTISKKK